MLTLVKGTDYTLTYADTSTEIGSHKVTITGNDFYTGTVTKTYKINPKGKALTKVTKGNKSFTAKWKKATSAEKKNFTKYQIRYSTKKSMAGAKKKTVKKTASKVTIKKLKAKKTYYVQIRTYKTVNGVKYYSKWSTAKKVKTR